MPTVPTPLRVILGLAATAADEVRKLPESLPALATNAPMVAVSSAMQASMKVQQRVAELAARGDELLLQLRGAPAEAPSWATFDETPAVAPDLDAKPATVAATRPASPSSSARAAFDRIDYEHTGYDDGDSDRRRWDAVGVGGADVRPGVGSLEAESLEAMSADAEVAGPDENGAWVETLTEIPPVPQEFDEPTLFSTTTDEAATTPTSNTPAAEVPAKKAPAKKAPATTVPATTVPAKKAPAKKVPAKKVPAKQVPAKNVPAKKVPANKVPAKKAPATTVPAKKVPAQKVPAKKVPAKKVPVAPTPSGAARGATATKSGPRTSTRRAEPLTTAARRLDPLAQPNPVTMAAEIERASEADLDGG
jgi:hypothetical protein